MMSVASPHEASIGRAPVTRRHIPVDVPCFGPSQSGSIPAHFKAGKTAAQASGDSATANRSA
jgi:hypothetical protein